MLGLSINPYVQLVLQFRGWAWAQQLHPGKQQHVTETGTTLNPQKLWVQKHYLKNIMLLTKYIYQPIHPIIVIIIIIIIIIISSITCHLNC